MANTAKWIAGAAGLTWAVAGFTATDFNSLASGSVVVAATNKDNSANLDLYADVSFALTVGGTTTAASFVSLYILPLDQDGATYGDGAANGTTAPVSGYLVATIGVKAGVTSGNVVNGTFRGIVLPPGDMKFAIVNNLTVALNAAAAASVKYRTYNENLNG
jgi:hypothetical protein